MDRLSGIYTRISQYVLIILGVLLALSLNVDSVRLAGTLWQNAELRGQLVSETVKASPSPSKAEASGSSPRRALQQLQSLGLPIGWSLATCPTGPLGVVFAIFGWLFTVVAVAMGAPFWFSLLQQVTNFRNAGPKPGRADSFGAGPPEVGAPGKG
jgi:hypothetical protein